MSIPISPITSIACGLTRVASVPALVTSKLSPARYRSSPSAIWERAELWVHRNSTLRRVSALCSTIIPPGDVEVTRDPGEEASRRLAVERVEAPPPAPLLAHEPCLFQPAEVVGDLRLAHLEALLELADADPRRVPLAAHGAHGRAKVRQVAAPAPTLRLGGQHPEHPHPDGVRERPSQRHDALDPLPGRGDLFRGFDLCSHHVHHPATGLRARMKALARGTSRSASTS